MSIERMISAHPQAGADFNPVLALAVEQALECAAVCNACADACSAEPMDMRRCIRLCMDCSDVCTATYRIATRRTDHNRQLIRTMLATCIEACDVCRAESEKHDNAHCRHCAATCRQCAGHCRAALIALNEEVHEAA